MNIGTRSILYGAHCWFIHPWFVAWAWVKLYGWPRDFRIWVAFFVHDLGYWGKPNMDGPEGEDHVLLGADLMHRWFDKTILEERAVLLQDVMCLLDQGWELSREEDNNEWVPAHVALGIQLIWMQRRETTWRDFCLYHSRFYANRNGEQISRLCVADKLAISLEPWWLYIPRVWLTGEAKEYMSLRYDGGKYSSERDSSHPVNPTPTLREWKREIDAYCSSWALTHKDLPHA